MARTLERLGAGADARDGPATGWVVAALDERYLLELLVYFVEHRGETLSRNELLDKVWGFDAMPTTRTVDVHISWLRQQIEPDPSNPRYLLTVRGLGYRFVG